MKDMLDCLIGSSIHRKLYPNRVGRQPQKYIGGSVNGILFYSSLTLNQAMLFTSHTHALSNAFIEHCTLLQKKQ
jgi:hypothetical protein